MASPASPPTLQPTSTSAVCPRPLLRGALVGERYRVGDKIADGGMGAIYGAIEEGTGRRVAIKLLRPDIANAPQVRERFMNEARATMSIAHPNVIEILGTGELECGMAYYVMELVDGDSLADIGAALDLGTIIEIGRQICEGLAAAHARGVVHRDLKPENIIVATEAGALRCKLIDFGIAKVPFAGPLTVPGQVLGTPAYLAPEQARAQTAVDHRCDIYALGVILYELIAGRLPLDHDDPMRLVLAHQFEAPPPLTAWRADCPAKLAGIVMKCLAKDPAHRFSSAAALGHELQLLEQVGPADDDTPAIDATILFDDPGLDYGKTVLVHRGRMPVSVSDLVGVLAPPAPPTAMPPAPIPRAGLAPARRTLPWWVVAVVIAIAVLGVGAWLLFRQ